MNKTDKMANIVGLAGLYIFVLSLPYSPALSETGFWISLSGALVLVVHNRRVSSTSVIYTVAVIFFLIAVGMTVPFSMDVSFSIRKFFIVRWLFFPYVILNLGLDRKTINRLLSMLLIVSGIFSLYLLMQHLSGRAILPYKFDVYQTVNSSNTDISDRIALRFGQYYAVLFTFVVVFTYLNKDSRHMFRGVVSALSSIAVTYFAYARSGALGIWSSFIVFGLLKARTILYGIILITGIGLAFVFMFPHAELSELVYSTLHPTQVSGVRYGSNVARIHMVDNTIEILKQHPFTGAGFNCYGKWTTINRPEDAGWERTFSDPVEFLATTGVIGFLGFLILYAALFYVLFKYNDSLSNAVLAAFMVFAAGGVFEPMFFNTVLLRGMMFLIGLSMTMYNGSKAEKI
jgi:O-Antigen ligase